MRFSSFENTIEMRPCVKVSRAERRTSFRDIVEAAFDCIATQKLKWNASVIDESRMRWPKNERNRSCALTGAKFAMPNRCSLHRESKCISRPTNVFLKCISTWTCECEHITYSFKVENKTHEHHFPNALIHFIVCSSHENDFACCCCCSIFKFIQI